jgi:hypothetical protein
MLQPPEIPPMTPDQKKAVIRALVALLDSWLVAKSRLGSERDADNTWRDNSSTSCRGSRRRNRGSRLQEKRVRFFRPP